MAIPAPLWALFRVQNLKAISALESAYNHYPHLPWALWENRKYHNCGSGARAHNDNFHTRVSSFIGQHFGKKIGLLPTAGGENHAFGGFHTPPTNALKVWENATFAKSPGTYCKVMSSAQEHLSVICAKFLRLQVAQIRAWKLCRKPFQGLLLGTRGTENFTQCLTMKHWSGANFWHQFRARPWKWPAQVLGRFGYCGLMGPNGKIFQCS